MTGKSLKKSNLKDVFSLDHTDFRILQFYSSNGESNRNQVREVSKYPYVSIKDKQISRRVEKLAENEFLRVVGKRKIVSINKTLLVYGLTFKGLIASSFFHPITSSYVMKKYFKLIPDPLEKFVQNLVLNDINFFIQYHIMIGSNFDIMRSDTITLSLQKKLYDFDLISDETNRKKLKGIMIERQIHEKSINDYFKKHHRKKEFEDVRYFIVNYPIIINWILISKVSPQKELDRCNAIDKMELIKLDIKSEQYRKSIPFGLFPKSVLYPILEENDNLEGLTIVWRL